MKNLGAVFLWVLAGVSAVWQSETGFAQEPAGVALSQIRLRDVFIFPEAATRTYYLVTSVQRPPHSGTGVSVFTSKDLELWHGPFSVFDLRSDDWANGKIWAPEMHFYNGKYYLFTTFNASNAAASIKRGTVILAANSPMGPFREFNNRSHTPTNELALDGTFWVEDGVPYMVYCHEWVQIKDGTINMLRLKPDLSDADGPPKVLFKGSDAPWTGRRETYVTDGPYLYQSKSGELMMIWSSFIGRNYATGVAVSASGRLEGPWVQQRQPLFDKDGGHGMIFRKFDGTLMLLLHQPNQAPNERARLFELEDTGDSLHIKSSAQTK